MKRKNKVGNTISTIATLIMVLGIISGALFVFNEFIGYGIAIMLSSFISATMFRGFSEVIEQLDYLKGVNREQLLVLDNILVQLKEGDPSVKGPSNE